MSVINQMNEKLANMIAAGEVVERPASIIKELVENSIDAKATTIDIFVKDLGLKEIKVLDNGVGIHKDDLKKAFLRHATSKVFKQEDLMRINTLGFRGEALAAIVSVSKVTLKSRKNDSDGYYVKFVDSKVIEEGKVSLNEGTEITVNDLFYNTPARLKYLKSEFSERKALIDIFDRLAMSNPNIRFSLTIDEKLVKETYGNGDYYSLIRQIYGANILKDIKTFDEDFANINVSGYLISPNTTRSNRQDITIFINGRYIKNYQLTQAVIDGYKDYLMTNRYPIAIISILIDPFLLDVNVHPQKLEVKISNESLMKYQLEKIIRATLTNQGFKIAENITVIDKEIIKDELYIKESLDFIYNDEVKPILNEDTEAMVERIPDMEYVGTFASTYLLFQNESGLYLIDQHAAEERVNYEHLYNNLNDDNTYKVSLLLPRELNLTNSDFEFINNNIKLFDNLLFEFNSNNELISHPSYLMDFNLDDIILTIISLIENDSLVNIKSILDELIKDISCKASVKANHKLSLIEIESLFKRLKNAKNPYTCPHGRPTIIHLTNYQIERMFKRVV